jgi:hypothetical protein
MNKKPTVEKIEAVEPPPSQLVGKDSIEDIVADRDRALEHLEKGLREIEEYEKLSKARSGSSVSIEVGDESIGYGKIDAMLDLARKDIDSRLWRKLLGMSGYKSLMDAKAIAEFEEQMREAPHELTAENVYATLEGLRSMSPQLFTRGVVNVFRQLQSSYRSNKSFRVNERIIYYLGGPYDYYCNARDNELNDVDRVFHLLDGRDPPTEYGHRLAYVVRESARARKGHVETNYYKLKIFRNGNLHIYFKRRDLLDKVNKLIAQECGEVLADDSSAKEGVHAKATIRKPGAGGEARS